MLKVPPQSVDVEKTVLGSALTDKKACEMMIEHVDSGDYFYLSSHMEIYKTILAMVKNNTVIDIVTLLEELKKKEVLDQCGGESYISELVDSVSTTSNILAHIKILREKF